jgi:HAD superfamily hydrolase (TIGR01662 family)
LAISVVLFDLGSTLYYFDGIPHEVFPRMDRALVNELVRFGYEIDPVEFIDEFVRLVKEADNLGEQSWIEIPTFDIVRTVLKEFGYPQALESHIRQALIVYYAVSQAHWKLELDTVPMLLDLKQKGYLLGIISNASDAQDVRTLLARENLAGFFEEIWISSTVGVCKPHPEIFHQAQEYFQIPMSEIVLVGDTLATDIAGAKQVGMRSVWITRRADRPENQVFTEEIIPDFQINTLAELPDLLNQLVFKTN